MNLLYKHIRSIYFVWSCDTINFYCAVVVRFKKNMFKFFF